MCHGAPRGVENGAGGLELIIGITSSTKVHKGPPINDVKGKINLFVITGSGRKRDIFFG